jgi:hypothetical protein
MTRLIIVVLAVSLMFVGISYAEIDPESLAGAWLLDEGGDDTTGDSSGNGNDGEIFGAKWVDGKFGSALEFNGVDNIVVVPHSDTFNVDGQFSLGLWLYWRGYIQFDTVISKGQQHYRIFIENAIGDIHTRFAPAGDCVCPVLLEDTCSCDLW